MEDFRKKIVLIILVAAVVIFLAQALPPLVKGGGPVLKSLFNLPGGSFSQIEETAVKKEAISRRFGSDETSPFFGSVRISAMNFSAPVPSLKITFSGDKQSAAVNATGWKIKTNGAEAIIPQAFENYDSKGGTLRDIVLTNGQSAVFYGAGNSFGNFRTNKCSGFLQDTYNFNPPLGLTCPAVEKSQILNLSGKCQNYILSLPSCSLPKADFINSLSSDYADSACRDYLNRINYDTCRKKYARDKDFYADEWRAWLGQNIFDSQHDWVRLFDEKGLLVDEFIY